MYSKAAHSTRRHHSHKHWKTSEPFNPKKGQDGCRHVAKSSSPTRMIGMVNPKVNLFEAPTPPRHLDPADHFNLMEALHSSHVNLRRALAQNATSTVDAPGWLASARQLVAIDFDSVTGMALQTPDEVALVLDTLWEALSIHPTDSVVIGMCSITMQLGLPAFARRNVQYVVRDGKDGADLAIADAIDLVHQAKRHQCLTVVTGDHFFAELAGQAKDLGMKVWHVATNLSKASYRFREVADRQTTLDVYSVLHGSNPAALALAA